MKCLRFANFSVACRCGSFYKQGMKIIGTSLRWLIGFWLSAGTIGGQAAEIDFNRDIRAILSNRCLTCHGPDEAERKADLRLDKAAGSRADLGGYAAIVPGDPEASELLIRILTDDEDDRMPPSETGAALTPEEITLLRKWIEEGADYARHWAYNKPERPALPGVTAAEWVRNPIDRFVLTELERQGMEPSAEADRWALARRVAIDLTGLPPSQEEVDAFLTDEGPLAYERYVDGLLADDAFGERWARVWLDLARYADSAGYADDPPRTIWAYRDYVIKALNENLPFDQFTIEQLAGDLLPNPSERQLIATAFHRNTMTNNEGGTNDEQFRNEAIVDRVNTTMQVWMGTTIGCAQCHTHKYDPITQEEYFSFFAFFNNTEDSDQRDERPLLSLYTEAQKQQTAEWRQEVVELKERIARPNDVVAAEQRAWERRLSEAPIWKERQSVTATAKERTLTVDESGVVRATGERPDTEVYTLRLPLESEPVTAIRLETLPQESPYAVTQVKARWEPAEPKPVTARFVRIELPGDDKILSLAEVEVQGGGVNVAKKGTAKQNSTAFGGEASRAIDGNTDGEYYSAESTTHTSQGKDPWWELDLGEPIAIDSITVWNRTDGGDAISGRLSGFRLILLGADRSVVGETVPVEVPRPQLEIALGGSVSVKLIAAEADYEERRSRAESVLQDKLEARRAWSVARKANEAHHLSLVLASALPTEAGELVLTVGQESAQPQHLLDGLRVATTEGVHIAELTRVPTELRDVVRRPSEERTSQQAKALAEYFRTVAPSLEPLQSQLAAVEKKLADDRPYTTVPILRELAPDENRETRIQIRGNYLNTSDQVAAKTPAAFHPMPADEPKNRLSLARWLVSPDNPLTARVIANRHWEQLFGRGIVSTSEEFGSQGELPSHPELLDWMAAELMDSGWDLKHLIKLMVSSSAYRQSSKLTEEMLAQDPDNQYYGRGPRFRLSAEMIRDQALALGGLLSHKKFGPPVRPEQPEMGLSAAFGSGIDWKTSQGPDRYRRGIYTNWRRSNPYPSMTTFDAPTREVCTIRRPRSNTPLQALVTLNDPVYVETAQGLARLIVEHEGSLSEKVDWAFRRALVRPAKALERDRLVALYEATKTFYDGAPEEAKEMATNPLGDPGDGADLAELGAWTVVGNVLLNLDEIFLKR